MLHVVDESQPRKWCGCLCLFRPLGAELVVVVVAAAAAAVAVGGGGAQFKKFDYDAKTGKGSSGLEDMVLISKISEEAIVENIKKRYNDDLIYVRFAPSAAI